MSTQQLFKNYILADVPVVLELPSRQALTQLLKTLAGLKFRYLRNIKEYGLEELDIFEGRSICSEVLKVAEDGTLSVRIWLAHKQSGVQFKVISQQLGE